jgi:hypothetical protein
MHAWPTLALSTTHTLGHAPHPPPTEVTKARAQAATPLEAQLVAHGQSAKGAKR